MGSAERIQHIEYINSNKTNLTMFVFTWLKFCSQTIVYMLQGHCSVYEKDQIDQIKNISISPALPQACALEGRNLMSVVAIGVGVLTLYGSVGGI